MLEQILLYNIQLWYDHLYEAFFFWAGKTIVVLIVHVKVLNWEDFVFRYYKVFII